MPEHDPSKRASALFAAGHALAETRLGLPYTSVSIDDGSPKWDAPERPLAIASMEEAQALLTRLRAGEASVKAFAPDSGAILETWSAADRDAAEEAAQWIRARGGEPESFDQAQALVNEPANAAAIQSIADELLRAVSLTMEEIDFLVDAADGDDDALDGLARYRELFSKDRIPWPDST